MSFLIPAPGLDSWFWKVLENYIYHVPSSPPHTYHGWDMLFDPPAPYAAWSRLARRKYYGRGKENTEINPITREDFDALLGHTVAVADTAAYTFAEELIAAYPEAKVVPNHRKDVDAWHASFLRTLIASYMSWPIHIIGLFEARMWWSIHGAFRIMVPQLLGMPYGSRDLETAARENGKMAYRNYCNKVRGLVPKDRLLEWTVGDGWEPLCQFIGKEVPDEPFPHVNSSGTEWKSREDAIMGLWARRAARNFVLCVGGIGAVVAIGIMYRH